MLNRLLVAIIGIPALITVYLKGGVLLLAFVNIVILLGLYEFFKMSKDIGKNPETVLGYLFGLMIPNLIYFTSNRAEFLYIPLIFLLLTMLIKRVCQNRIEGTSGDIGITVLGVSYVSLLFTHLILLSKLPNGALWLLVVQVLVWISDSSAYFVGISIGRKFFKDGFSKISPKKSVEGAIGSVVFTSLALWGIDRYYLVFDNKVGVVWIILIGALISVIAQVGDLSESMFKREFKIKDSGKILGEHGGILDRFDSMLFVVPVVYYILLFI